MSLTNDLYLKVLRASPVVWTCELRADGEDDWRVHVRHSRMMADALRDLGKPVEYLEFKGETHGFLFEKHKLRFYSRLVAFFEKHLAPQTPESGGSGSALPSSELQTVD